ncbi:MAG: hypothetical protein LUD72_09540 [Bacteroidales bacterium]|nr:hypothetical protein [Bacteroidales bacterium]
MLDKSKMLEIIELKKRGYSKAQIYRYYEGLGKPVSRPTIDKYFDMPEIPTDPKSSYSKPKAFEVEPFHSEIVAIMEANHGRKIFISSVYDLLVEKFVEDKDYPYTKLPGNQQTLRNYVNYLEKTGEITRTTSPGRVYQLVEGIGPGEQALIDFGQYHIGRNKDVHFICILLRYSRMLFVFAQDHKYNGVEACEAIYRFFLRIGGRVKELVIDQDAIFVADETDGEVTLTKTLQDFVDEQGIKLWVCNGADPESKGPIENSVKFVKTCYWSARAAEITCIDDVWKTLPAWVERQNTTRIHRVTYRIPKELFEEEEKEHLLPLLPSTYDRSPGSFREYEVKSIPDIVYKGCKYSVPKEYAYKTVLFKVVNNKIYIYDMNHQFICVHAVSDCKGSTNTLTEHKRTESAEWMGPAERLRQKWPSSAMSEYINGIHETFVTRHTAVQLFDLEAFLDSENPDKSFLITVLEACCEQKKFGMQKFRVVYDLCKAEQTVRSKGKKKTSEHKKDVQIANRSFYEEAVKKRTVKKEDDV